jgi:membrane-bound lytic murein transglycosylase F
MRIRLASAFITALVLLQSVCYSASRFPDRYDDAFERAALHLPAGTDWRLLKAQCYQESRLRPRAVSPVGAVGLCQFMPGTWADMQRRYPDLTDPYLPIQSIRAAAIYMRDLSDGWSSPRPQDDRYKLALASYNAGFGNILKAQKRCDMAVLYDRIVPPCLPCVTGRHSKETTEYVELIWGRWWPAMRLQ